MNTPEENVMPDDGQDNFAIHGVQVFAAGTWGAGGDTYDIEHLDQMVEASKAVGFVPPLKIGHTTDTSLPAAGWVEGLHRRGEALFADFVSISRAVYDAIRARRFDRTSAEIYWNLSRNGQVYPRVLGAIALLGAAIPAVDLPALSSFLSSAPETPRRYAFPFPFEPDGRQFWQRAGEALLALAKDRARDNQMSLSAAFHEVAAEHPEVRRAYSQKLKGA